MWFRKSFLILIVVSCAILASCQAVVGEKLSATQLKELIDSKQNVFLLDVRTPIEVREDGMIPGSVNIPLNELPDRLNEVPRDKKVITICARGVRAKKASDLLAKRGDPPPQTAAVADWKAMNYQVVYPAPAGGQS